MNSILLMFHVSQNAGYAIDSLYAAFIQMAGRLVGDNGGVHVSFSSLVSDVTDGGLLDNVNIIEFDPSSNDREQHVFISEYIKHNGIDVVFGFDQPVRQPSYKHLRKAGVRRIISYQGAPMSSLNKGLVLKLKQLDVWLSPGSPDHYIFESKAMAETASRGRGIPAQDISVVYLGVDENTFQPACSASFYAHDVFDIPRDRRIIYYSGHISERKGVAVLIRAAMHLRTVMGRGDFHFLILGNRGDEERRYLDMMANHEAIEYVTFGGYRNDVDKLLPSCFVGTIASTGWDSFTMSSLEIAACGLPLIVSDLQGLTETMDDGETGYLFMRNDHVELAEKIAGFLDNPEERDLMGVNARNRILAGFTRKIQVDRLVDVMRAVTGA